jgi:hypothetical protein
MIAGLSDISEILSPNTSIISSSCIPAKRARGAQRRGVLGQKEPFINHALF